jgi:hypothetical protein
MHRDLDPEEHETWDRVVANAVPCHHIVQLYQEQSVLNRYWRVTTGEITWSDRLYRIFEFDQSIPVTLERIGTRVHPEDIPLLHDMIDQARGAGTDVECEPRLQMPDQFV